MEVRGRARGQSHYQVLGPCCQHRLLIILIAIVVSSSSSSPLSLPCLCLPHCCRHRCHAASPSLCAYPYLIWFLNSKHGRRMTQRRQRRWQVQAGRLARQRVETANVGLCVFKHWHFIMIKCHVLKNEPEMRGILPSSVVEELVLVVQTSSSSSYLRGHERRTGRRYSAVHLHATPVLLIAA